ncbi:MAG: helix-turn-helix transcriptional regulator [Alphaproteobacteria bacterium]|nr:helix-turn-helix transcriptional regulator [Alphaproteobacteria bacterium]
MVPPPRLSILSQLAINDATVGQLAKPFQMSMPAVSRHLKVLENAGLIERSVDAQWRRCKLVSSGLKPAADWIGSYRKFWEGQLNALDDFLKETEPKGDV